MSYVLTTLLRDPKPTNPRITVNWSKKTNKILIRVHPMSTADHERLAEQQTSGSVVLCGHCDSRCLNLINLEHTHTHHRSWRLLCIKFARYFCLCHFQSEWQREIVDEMIIVSRESRKGWGVVDAAQVGFRNISRRDPFFSRAHNVMAKTAKTSDYRVANERKLTIALIWPLENIKQACRVAELKNARTS